MDESLRIWFLPPLDPSVHPPTEARDRNPAGVDATKNACWSFAPEAIFVRRDGCAQVIRVSLRPDGGFTVVY